MADFNKIILAGNLTRNPDVRNIKVNGDDRVIASCGIAVNRKYKDKQEVMFIDFTAYGKLAEILGTYTLKGSPVLIEGRLVFNQWEQDGQKHSKHEVVVEAVQMLGSKNDKSNQESGQSTKQPATQDIQTITEEDVPF